MGDDDFAGHFPLDYDDFFEDIDGLGDMLSQPCVYCGKSFATNGLLEIHRQKVHEELPLLACRSCNVDFKRKMGLITHWRTAPAHRRSDGVKLVGCDICDAFNVVNGFRDEEAVKSHTSNVHGEHVLVNTPDQAKSFCPLCRSEFTYRKGMIEHLQVLHGEHLLTDLLGVTGSEKERLMEDLHFKCPHCSKVFRVKKSLNQHLEKMHGDFSSMAIRGPSWRAPLSPVMSGNQSSVSSGCNTPQSKASRPAVPQSAQKKGQLVATPADLPASNAVSHQDAMCNVCSKTFSRPSILKVHLQMVHDSAPTITTPQKDCEALVKYKFESYDEDSSF